MEVIEPSRSRSSVTSSASVSKRTGTSNSKPAVIATLPAGDPCGASRSIEEVDRCATGMGADITRSSWIGGCGQARHETRVNDSRTHGDTGCVASMRLPLSCDYYVFVTRSSCRAVSR
jgi:hypothetical protein